MAALRPAAACRGEAAAPRAAWRRRKVVRPFFSESAEAAAFRRRAAAPRRQGRLHSVAMVNVDLSPATILGSGMVLAGLSLWQMRASRPELSRDMDVVFSSVGVLVGGILIFQGWRLDPLLLFGQLLTVSAAVSFAVEAIGLRRKVMEQGGAFGAAAEEEFQGGRAAGSVRPLPPPSATPFGSQLREEQWVGGDGWYGATPYEPPSRREEDYTAEDEYSGEQQQRGQQQPGRDRGGGGRGRRRSDVDMMDDWGA